jgi:hypothetical protein
MTCTHLLLAISILPGLAFAQNSGQQMESMDHSKIESHVMNTNVDGSKNPTEEKIDPYKARFGLISLRRLPPGNVPRRFALEIWHSSRLS